MAILSIGGVDMPAPSEFSVGIQDIVKAERNAKGTMIKELIATKRKIEVNWKALTAAQMSIVLNAVSSNFFAAAYLDPLTNTTRSATFYSGDRIVPVLIYRNGTPTYKDFKVSLIER